MASPYFLSTQQTETESPRFNSFFYSLLKKVDCPWAADTLRSSTNPGQFLSPRYPQALQSLLPVLAVS